MVMMAFSHEQQVMRLMTTIHSYAERNQQLQKNLDELEKEYAERTMIRVPFGSVSMDTSRDIYRMDTIYRVAWRPDPMQMSIALSDAPMSDEKFPRLVEAVCRRFEQEFLPAVTRQLRTEYHKLYSSAAHRR